MTATTLALILVSVTLSALAQIAFKFGVTATAGQGGLAGLASAVLTPGVLCGLVLYGFGTLLWLTVLSRVEVSQAYPFVGLGFALTALLGIVLFDETLSLERVLGMLLIGGGIVLVARS